MDLSTEFTKIESIPFWVEMGLAGGFKSFFRNIDEQPAVEQLREATATPEGLSLLQERIKYLCTQAPDLADTALAVYLHLLYKRDRTLAKEAAALVYPLPNTLWAYGISQAILEQAESKGDPLVAPRENKKSMNNHLIIDIGGPRDKRSLPLATKLGTRIPNVQYPEQDNPQIRQSSIEMFSGRPKIQLRSWSKTYNCMGMVFASRRTNVDMLSLPMILREDDYRKLSGPDHAQLGDVVVYIANGGPKHVGLIAKIEVNLSQGQRDLWILSKWGSDGEYLHQPTDVPVLYGAPTEYWTDRR